jgi:hypothetical protein
LDIVKSTIKTKTCLCRAAAWYVTNVDRKGNKKDKVAKLKVAAGGCQQREGQLAKQRPCQSCSRYICCEPKAVQRTGLDRTAHSIVFGSEWGGRDGHGSCAGIGRWFASYK